MNRSILSQEDASSYLDLQTAMRKNEEREDLFRRMMQQQVELQQLQEKQKALLKAQQQVSKIDYTTTQDLQEKLERLQSVKQRIATLQSVLDEAETSADLADSSSAQIRSLNGAGDSSDNKVDYANTSNLVNEQLEDLYATVTSLLTDIDKMNALCEVVDNSQGSTGWEIAKPASLRSTANVESNSAEDPSSPLPRVKLIDNNSEKNAKYDLKQAYESADNNLVERHCNIRPASMLKLKTSSESSFDEATAMQRPVSELWQEMRRYQSQLAELQQRRKELTSYIQASDGFSKPSSTSSAVASQTIDDYKQAQNHEPNNNSQGLVGTSLTLNRYFLNTGASKAYNFDASTERTNATWGGSTSTSGDESVGSIPQQDTSALTDLNKSSLPDFVETMVLQLWNELDSQNNFLQLLLDDQKALSVLLENTLNMQKDRYSTVMYGISPDFLIYQLDNCSAQIMVYRKNIVVLHKELQDIQKQYPEIDLSYNSARSAHLRYLVEEDSTPTFDDTNSFSPRKVSQTRRSTPLKYYTTSNVNRDSIEKASDSYSHIYQAYQRTSPFFVKQQLDSSPSKLSKSTAENNQSMSKDSSDQLKDDKELYVSITDSPKSNPKFAKESTPQLSSSEKVKGALSKAKIPARNVSLKSEISDLDSNASGYPLFEALRDTIYSEAATLISQNEARPHFLIELFHELQQLNSDYLRQHCLFVIRDVVNGYIIETPKGVDEAATRKIESAKPSNSSKAKSEYTDLISAMKPLYSENTPSDTEGDSENGAVHFNQRSKASNIQYDYALDVSNASNMTTPISSLEYTGSAENNSPDPFEVDFLGSTVIHLDEALQRVREMERIKQEQLEEKEAELPEQEKSPEKPSSGGDVDKLDAHKLDGIIKQIINKVIPVVKSKSEVCGEEKIAEISRLVARLVAEERLLVEASRRGKDESGAVKANSDRQLQSVLAHCLNKFLGYHLNECGEEVIVDISEVLFNELAYIFMIEDYGELDRDEKNQAAGKTPSRDQDSQTQTSDMNDESDSSVSSSDDDEEDEEESSRTIRMEKDASLKEASSAADKGSVIVDLSVSETKPLTSYGSGEDEEAGSGEEYDQYNETDDVATSMQHDRHALAAEKENSPGREKSPRESN